MVARKRFNGKFISQNWFFDRALNVTYHNIGRLKSPHTLFDKYLDHMLVKLEQNQSETGNQVKNCEANPFVNHTPLVKYMP